MKRTRDTIDEPMSSAKRRKDARNHKISKSNSVVEIPKLKGQYVMSRKMLARSKKKPNRKLKIYFGGRKKQIILHQFV